MLRKHNIMNINDLKHVGIPGMKWGRRKSTGTKPAGELLKNKVTKNSDDVKKVGELRKKQIDEMSNEELSRVIKRMELQKRYKELNPSNVDKGKKAAKDIMSTINTVKGTTDSIIQLASIGSKLYTKIKASQVAG